MFLGLNWIWWAVIVLLVIIIAWLIWAYFKKSWPFS